MMLLIELNPCIFIDVQMKLLRFDKRNKYAKVKDKCFCNNCSELVYNVFFEDYWMRCLYAGCPTNKEKNYFWMSCFASLRITWVTELQLGTTEFDNFVSYETRGNM